VESSTKHKKGKRMNILITCEVCGKKKIRDVHTSRHTKVFFCSVKCRCEYRKTKGYHKDRKICIKCRYFFDKKTMKITMYGLMCESCYDKYGKVNYASPIVC
jgi:uncharacterized pyridoxamine 5'-phosphate oxidase family protein